MWWRHYDIKRCQNAKYIILWVYSCNDLMRSCLQKMVRYRESPVRHWYILKIVKKSPLGVPLFLPVPTLAVKLFITVTIVFTFFRRLPVFKSCTLKLSCVRFPTEGYSGEVLNKILTLCSFSIHSWVALPNTYGL